MKPTPVVWTSSSTANLCHSGLTFYIRFWSVISNQMIKTNINNANSNNLTKLCVIGTRSSHRLPLAALCYRNKDKLQAMAMSYELQQGHWVPSSPLFFHIRQLGTHYPDNALALVSAAGWIKKEDYGDSNLFFRHDISTSHTSPSVKSILEACTAENDADKHVTNLHVSF